MLKLSNSGLMAADPDTSQRGLNVSLDVSQDVFLDCYLKYTSFIQLRNLTLHSTVCVAKR